MIEPKNDYQNYIKQLDKEMKNQEMQHTIYLSRRAIWANILLCIFLSYIAGYIHTRRWKPLGIFALITSSIIWVTAPPRANFAESFQHGQKYALIASLIATIDNSIAIKKAKDKINNK